VEEVDARAVLGVSANASRREIETAYGHRSRQVREQYEKARDHRTREKCRRERDAIDEARSLLLDLEEEDRRQREENERLAAEQRQREENEHLTAEQRHPVESERLAAEQREREEHERPAAEQRQREENERLAAEQRQSEENERLAAEQRQREENERLAAEQRRRDESERLALEQRQREENERLATEERQRDESERLATEKRQRQERERLLAEQHLREERERVGAEQRRREEQERLAIERHQREQQQERLVAEQRERAEQERLAAINRQRQQKRRNAIWLVIGAAILVLAAAIAAPFFWVEWQNKNKPGKLVLNTVPATAAVFVDGVARGNTPLVLGDLAPGERHLRIDLKGYQEEQLVVVIEPGGQRYFPVVTLVRNKESNSNVTPAPTSPAETPSPAPITPVITPAPTSPVVTPAPTSPAVTPGPTSTAVTPAPTGLRGERYPQTRLRILTEADVADLDYAELRYAINEMYARHGAQFFREPDIRKQFEQFTWYVPMPGLTLARVDREFSRIERQNRDLLSRLRDQKRPK
jgi:hypothetical protein